MASTAEFRPSELVRLLSEADVDYVVVGGVAVVVLAHARYTDDLDICYATDRANLTRLGRVLVELGATLRGIEVDVPFVPDGRTLRGTQILCLNTPHGGLDLLAQPEGAPRYERLRSRAEVVEIAGVEVPVASIDDMIAMKRAAGRPQDLIDVDALEIAQTAAQGRKPIMSEQGRRTVEAEREPNFLLARPEKRALRAIARRLPHWVLPDDLTAIGVLSAIGICAAYVLSNESSAWLWVASGLLVVHWLGDSLDGTLARVREIQRPRYGYYLDHFVDAVSTALIGIGLGLSPYMLLSVGTLIVVAYLILSINVYLEAHALGRFSIGYGLIGPTEIRVILIALNTALALTPGGVHFTVGHTRLTPLDVVGIAIAAVMVVLLLVRAARNLRELAALEPAASRRGPSSRL